MKHKVLPGQSTLRLAIVEKRKKQATTYYRPLSFDNTGRRTGGPSVLKK